MRKTLPCISRPVKDGGSEEGKRKARRGLDVDRYLCCSCWWRRYSYTGTGHLSWQWPVFRLMAVLGFLWFLFSLYFLLKRILYAV